jgi:BirA family transcriptional regulator, biotin operon repressor / biotin---[acetyl-CoA-carboxylase] ligase
MATDSLAEFFIELARRGVAPHSAWPLDEDLEVYGLERRADQVVPMVPYEPLDPSEIRSAMSRAGREWLRHLEVSPVIGSTNAELMRQAQDGSVAGSVRLAEVQLQGRGRRGRSWYSPFAANLAVSIGLALDRAPSALGGASLVVGLAVLDALEQLTVPRLALKWPNDILLGGAKLGGILIEMIPAANGVQLVVGIGLNVSLPPRIRADLDQVVADLASTGSPPRRNLLAGKVISSVVEFVSQFQHLGFAPFIESFNARHYFHEQQVEIVHGGSRTPGRVDGVSEQGGLLLRTATGQVEFHGGEVSLRPSV